MIRLLLIVFLAALTGCENSSPTGTGSVIGNGFTDSDLLRYRNDKMDIEFSYPRTWSLDVSSDGHVVQLAPLVAGGNTSTALLSLFLAGEFDGIKFETVKQLEGHLQSTAGSNPWRAISFRWGQKGFYRLSYSGSQTRGEYVLLTTDRKILYIAFEAQISLENYNRIQQIINSMTLEVAT